MKFFAFMLPNNRMTASLSTSLFGHHKICALAGREGYRKLLESLDVHSGMEYLILRIYFLNGAKCALLR